MLHIPPALPATNDCQSGGAEGPLSDPWPILLAADEVSQQKRLLRWKVYVIDMIGKMESKQFEGEPTPMATSKVLKLLEFQLK